jgi:hypothetical protein
MQRDLASLTRNRLQLTGVAAMLVASKYEEIYAPEVRVHRLNMEVDLQVYLGSMSRDVHSCTVFIN